MAAPAGPLRPAVPPAQAAPPAAPAQAQAAAPPAAALPEDLTVTPVARPDDWRIEKREIQGFVRDVHIRKVNVDTPPQNWNAQQTEATKQLQRGGTPLALAHQLFANENLAIDTSQGGFVSKKRQIVEFDAKFPTGPDGATKLSVIDEAGNVVEYDPDKPLDPNKKYFFAAKMTFEAFVYDPPTNRWVILQFEQMVPSRIQVPLKGDRIDCERAMKKAEIFIHGYTQMIGHEKVLRNAVQLNRYMQTKIKDIGYQFQTRKPMWGHYNRHIVNKTREGSVEAIFFNTGTTRIFGMNWVNTYGFSAHGLWNKKLSCQVLDTRDKKLQEILDGTSPRTPTPGEGDSDFDLVVSANEELQAQTMRSNLAKLKKATGLTTNDAVDLMRKNLENDINDLDLNLKGTDLTEISTSAQRPEVPQVPRGNIKGYMDSYDINIGSIGRIRKEIAELESRQPVTGEDARKLKVLKDDLQATFNIAERLRQFLLVLKKEYDEKYESVQKQPAQLHDLCFKEGLLHIQGQGIESLQKRVAGLEPRMNAFRSAFNRRFNGLDARYQAVRPNLQAGEPGHVDFYDSFHQRTFTPIVPPPAGQYLQPGQPGYDPQTALLQPPPDPNFPNVGPPVPFPTFDQPNQSPLAP